MSRPTPSSASLSHLPFSQLQQIANDLDTPGSHPPKVWFEKARHEADKAVLAERVGKQEEMFVAYVRACQSYTNVKNHPSYAEERKKDMAWAGRVKDFKETYEAFLGKAKAIKEKLKERDVEKSGSPGSTSTVGSQANGSGVNGPSASRQPSGPDAGSLGSIADRMRLLSGKGMNVEPSPKRFSKESSPAPPRSFHTDTSPSSPSRQAANHADGDRLSKTYMGGNSVTGGAGNLGVARLAGQQQRGQHEIGDGKRSRAGSSASSKQTGPPHSTHRESIAPNTPAPSSGPATVVGNQSPAGRTSRSRRSTDASLSAAPTHQPNGSSNNVSPNHSGNPSQPEQSPQPSRSYLPSVPSDPVKNGSNSAASQPPAHPESPAHSTSLPRPDPPAKTLSADNLHEFEKAFPSLTEFSKQYDEPPAGFAAFARDPDSKEDVSGMPNVRSNELKHPVESWRQAIHEDDEENNFPDVAGLPSLPSLPSVPRSKPGLPTPPSKPDELRGGVGPPSPDPHLDIRRPVSTPNVAALNDSSKEQERTTQPPARSPLGPRPPVHGGSANANGTQKVNGMTSPIANEHSPAVSFPVPQPTARPSKEKDKELLKPKFPFSNSIDCDSLRSYFLNPAVDVLLLDVRPEEEFQKGYVGVEYEQRGAKINIVWLDPTVVMRDGMDSTKLEDALSLSPEAQRKHFENRDKYDVVVVYDSHSQGWPRKDMGVNGTPPLARLWEIIYQDEFGKRLQRTPVLMTGGYDAWVEFIKMRGAMHAQAWAAAQANGHGQGRKVIPNGHGPVPPPPRERERERSGSGGELSKRANRDMPVYQGAQYAKNISESIGYAPQSMTGEQSYSRQRTYVSSPPPLHSSTRLNHSPSPSLSQYASPSIAPPPQASIHPGPGARRRSDYVEQHNQSYSGYTPSSSRPSIDYPQAHALAHVPQPPPAAQSHPSERSDPRAHVVRSSSMRGLDQVARDGDELPYWNDVVLGLTGLKNLGNTCYMNSTLQCLSATYPFTTYFLDGSFKKSINVNNPLGMKGNLALAFAELLKALWKEDYTFLSPVTFRKQIIGFAQQFSGTDQHDSQEFLSFVLDGLHEDLNRIKHKPPAVEMTPEREAALETLPPEVASEKEWQIYRMRNDSFIVDLFQGQYRNRLECLTCHKTSTTYDTFMYLSLPVPAGRTKVVVQELIDEFVKPELLDKEDAWNCPRCKVPRRAAKSLTISRLPPVLLIQLKRFTTQNGVFWDKSETPVIFPVKGLDLTRYVPHRQPTGREDLDDPRTQVGPFKYDLYGVSNHMGTLSSGHYTAYVKSSKGWMYCEDSRVTKAQEKDVVSRPAYILFYKRIRV